MGRMQNRLTAKQVEAAQDGWYNDGGNLHLRVGNGGQSKKWVLRYARNGKVTEIGLGAVSQGVTLKQARTLRHRHMTSLADGLDPREEKRKLAAARQNRKTFAEAAEELIAARRKNWRTNASDGRTSSLDDWTKHLTVDCKRIANRSVSDIGVDDIKPIVRLSWDSGHTNTTRRLLRHIEAVFDYAKAHSWRKGDNPAAWGVFQHILQAQGPSGPKPHHPALKWSETPAFMGHLRAAEPTMAGMALEMMVLTACRSGEVRGMQWSEIDFDAAVWRVPPERMKRKLPHEVPLSADAMAIIKRLEAARIGKFVFPGRRSNGPVTNYPVWDLVQRLTGRADSEASMASVHGFRASFRSWCRAKKIRDDVAERALAHGREDATQAAYDREEMLEDRRKVMSDWAAFLSGADSNVVPIKRGAA
jgi:integrase